MPDGEASEEFEMSGQAEQSDPVGIPKIPLREFEAGRRLRLEA
jgi:hypothetical protein